MEKEKQKELKSSNCPDCGLACIYDQGKRAYYCEKCKKNFRPRRKGKKSKSQRLISVKHEHDGLEGKPGRKSQGKICVGCYSNAICMYRDKVIKLKIPKDNNGILILSCNHRG